MNKREQLISNVINDVVATIRQLKLATSGPIGSGEMAVKGHLQRSQAELLVHLKNHGEHSVKSIAGYMGITGSAVTQLVESLAQDNMIIRTTSELDRRVTLIAITEYGSDKLEEFRAERLKYITPIMATLTDDELIEFRRIHKKLMESALTRNDNQNHTKD